MKQSEVPRAVGAAVSVATALGLAVDDAAVLHDSNRLAVRLLPCGVLARVAHAAHHAGAEFEVEVARRLAEAGGPVAGLDPRVEPRVHLHEGFAVTLWTYYELLPVRDIAPGAYADALGRLHAGMRQIDLMAPHFTDRVAQAQRLVGDRSLTPALAEADRTLLSDTLANFTRAIMDRATAEQLLHGEPHFGNVLRTKHGLLFTDLETCCRGPVEFDIAHCSGIESAHAGASWYIDRHKPGDVCERYPGADPELVSACRVLMLAMVAAWRFDRDDRFPNGRRMGNEFVSEVRVAVAGHGLGA